MNPDIVSDYEIHDRRFLRLVNTMAKVERLWTGGRWTEGPVYLPAMGMALWSDVAGDRMLWWHEGTSQTGIFRAPSAYANGNSLDREGRLVTCEHQTRRVSRTEPDGRIVTLADRWSGKRLNSPNDLVVKSDDSIWFTDPTYGIVDDYQGRRAESEIEGCNVYRIDGQTGAVTIVADDFVRPNGLAFSPDEAVLYIVDSGRTEGPEHPAHVRGFTVNGKRLRGGQVVAECDNGVFDGLRCDEAGHLWISAGDGVRCHAPDGALLGKILIPEAVANLTFGGPMRNRLLITATTSLYAVYVTTNGAPFR